MPKTDVLLTIHQPYLNLKKKRVKFYIKALLLRSGVKQPTVWSSRVSVVASLDRNLFDDSLKLAKFYSFPAGFYGKTADLPI